MTIEAAGSNPAVCLFHFKQFVLVLEIAWCSLAVMLLLGKGKNKLKNKKEDVHEQKLTRTLAGAMSLMLHGTGHDFGDGSAQGLLHADTIASAAEVIEGAKNKDQLAKEFEEANKDLGKVDFFGCVADEKKWNCCHEDIRKNDIAVQSDEAGAAVQDRSAAVMAASEGDAPVGEDVTVIVKQVINGIQDKTPIYVRIFDENWK